MTTRETAAHFPHTIRGSPPARRTAIFRLSQEAHAVVGSPDSGSFAAEDASRSNLPVFWVLISNVLRQSAQTWLKQHFGSQEYTISRPPQCGHFTTSFSAIPMLEFYSPASGAGD